MVNYSSVESELNYLRHCNEKYFHQFIIDGVTLFVIKIVLLSKKLHATTLSKKGYKTTSEVILPQIAHASSNMPYKRLILGFVEWCLGGMYEPASLDMLEERRKYWPTAKNKMC
jgi:hypothetical protein